MLTAGRFDERYPIGRTRMAELSVLCCAVIMFVSTALVIREAAGALWEGFHGAGMRGGGRVRGQTQP